MMPFVHKTPPSHADIKKNFSNRASSPNDMSHRHISRDGPVHRSHHDSVVSHVLSSTNNSDSPASSSSSKAVLAALRTLQEKIRRLETDRSRALEETAALRHRLAGQEVESEQTRARDEAISQRNLQEARSAYDRLLAEKADLEVRVARAEDRRNDVRRAAEDVEKMLLSLRQEKESALAAIQEAEAQQRHLDIQLTNVHQRERELAQALAWDTQRHEEDMAALNARLHNQQEMLLAAVKDKSTHDAKMAETDHLVGQLLAVNETLVGKLTGNTRESNGSTSKKTTNKSKVSSKQTSADAKPKDVTQSARKARQESAAIAAAAALLEKGSATTPVVRSTKKAHSHGTSGKSAIESFRPPAEYVLATEPSQTTSEAAAAKFRTAKDVRSIQGVNKLYDDLVRQLIKTPERDISGKSGGLKRTPVSGAGLVAMSAGSRAALTSARESMESTRDGYNAAIVDTSLTTSNKPNKRTVKVEAPTFDSTVGSATRGLTDSDFLDLSRELDELALPEPPLKSEQIVPPHAPAFDNQHDDPATHGMSSTTTASEGPKGTPSSHIVRIPTVPIPSPSTLPLSAEIERTRGTYLDTVAALEGRMYALDKQYHAILAGTDSASNPDHNGQMAAPVEAAEQLVEVIRELHVTGQQLRDLRSSTVSQGSPDPHARRS